MGPSEGEGPPAVRRVRLHVVPCTLREANAFVEKHHRHHGRSQGHKFSVAVADEGGTIRGVAIAGRPVSRLLDDGLTLEVVRVATDGCPNACSALYNACRRVAVAMGYREVLTYTLESEEGTSLVASGWEDDGPAGGGSWNRPGRVRVDKAPTSVKRRWRTTLAD